MQDLTCLCRRAALSAFAGVLTLSAQNPNPQDDAFLLDDVVVTATREPRSAATLPANVTVITAEQIRHTTALDVADVLRHVAGVEVQDITGARGRTTRVDIRGFGETSSANMLVLVDGRRLNQPTLAGTDLTTVPLERVERIEIIRGASAVLYGDNVTGGVINIITRSGSGEDDRLHIVSDSRVGSFNTFKQSLDISGVQDGLSYSVNSSFHDSNGYRDNSHFRNTTVGARARWKSGDRLTMDISAGHKRDTYGLPGAIGLKAKPTSAAFAKDSADTETGYVNLTPSLQLGDDTELRVGFGYEEVYAMGDLTFFTTESRLLQMSLTPRLAHRLEVGDTVHSLLAGVDYHVGDYHNIQNIIESERKERAFYISDAIALGDSLFIDLGYRVADIDYNYVGQSDSGHRAEAANIGATWRYAPASKVFAGFQRAYRSQLVEDLNYPPPTFSASNPDLNPQVSDHWQIGIQHAFSRSLTTKATVFWIDTEDEIFYDPNIPVPGSFFPGATVSYAETERVGLELECRARVREDLTVGVNLTWLDAELGEGAYDGRTVPGTSEHYGSFFATYAPHDSPLTVDTRLRWSRNRTMISDWTNTADWDADFAVLDVMATWALTDVITLYAGVNNLLDEEYAEYGVFFGGVPAHYPSPEREFVGGVRLKFDW
jgi:iron complex outermembrane receptor protein